MAKTGTWTTEQIPPQQGRTFLITGANSGLGLESAMALATAGAKVILGCRDKGRGSQALAAVRALATGDEPELLSIDLADLDSIERAASELHESVDGIDVLMNNAGVMALPERRTAQGHEMQFGTNHLGHFALTARVLDLLLSSPDPRVVTTSSQAHRLGKMQWSDLDWNTRRYRRWPAYGQSKLANLLFSYELDRRAKHSGSTLRSIAAHPGYASTALQGTAAAMSGRALTAKIMDLGNSLVGQPASDGALPQLYASTSPDARSGGYYGPGGPAEMRGAPVEVQPSASAKRRDEAHRLWNVSEMITNVRFEWPVREPEG